MTQKRAQKRGSFWGVAPPEKPIWANSWRGDPVSGYPPKKGPKKWPQTPKSVRSRRVKHVDPGEIEILQDLLTKTEGFCGRSWDPKRAPGKVLKKGPKKGSFSEAKKEAKKGPQKRG